VSPLVLVRASAPDPLIAAAKARTGLATGSALLEYALARVALEGDVGAG